MTTIIEPGLEEKTLLQLPQNFCAPAWCEYGVQASDVFRQGLRRSNDVIKVDKAGLPPYTNKGDVGGTLEGGRGVLEASEHPCVPVRAKFCSIRCLVFFRYAAGISWYRELQSNV